MARKIRIHDKVIILSGKEKGKIGRVKKVLPSGKMIIEGINKVKKHQKSVSKKENGSIVHKESPIESSKVAIFNLKTKKMDRVGFRFEKGKKVRFFKSNKEVIK